MIRANIVAKLRREADRIEAGGDPACVVEALGAYGNDLVLAEVDSPEKARAALITELAGDYWEDAVDFQWWGVVVTIEEVACTEHRQALDTRDYDVWANYGVVDPDTYTGPKVVPGPCSACDDEVVCAPGEKCPNECRVGGHHGHVRAGGEPCSACACTEAT